MLAALIASDSEVVGSNPDPWCQRKGYELNKVEFEGQTCPSHLKMDVSLPDEPFLESYPLKERLASSSFWVKGMATCFCRGLKTPTLCFFILEITHWKISFFLWAVFFFQFFYPAFEKMEQPQTTKEGLNMASSYAQTFLFWKRSWGTFWAIFVHSVNKMNHFSQPIKYLINFYEIIYGGCIYFSLKFLRNLGSSSVN